MAIQISIDTTARQDAKLAIVLDRENSRRAAESLPPYADISAMMKVFVVKQLKNLVRSADVEDSEKVQTEYLEATDNVQAQVKTLLGIS